MNKEHSIYVRVNSKEATDINHEDHDSNKSGSGRSSWSLDTAWRLGVEEVVEFMQSDPQAGLTEREAQLRLQQLGPNSLAAKEQESLVIKYLEQFKEPLILLLLCSCLVSVLIGELADAFGIFIAVCTVNTVGFIQEYRSEKSVEALQNLVAHRTHVLRDGQPREVLAESLVPGDLVVLNVGDRVPADLRLIETINLELDESILTGETEPSVKCTEQLSSSSSSSSSVPEGGILEGRPRRDTEEFQLADRSNMAYMGTITVNGKGKGLVVATSTATELGRIWEAITSMGEKRTPLQLKMDQLGKQLSLAAFVIVGVIFILGAIQGKPLLQMFTIGVSLAVAAIPEGLPIVVTVTLALGVTRMANRHAIVRKLPAVEALGATTAICSDKTGTLTKNEMTVRRLFTTEFISVSGEGYHHQFWQQPQGEFFREGCDQPFDPAQDPHLMQLIQVGAICNNAHLREDGVLGQPTEVALLVLARKAGIEIDLRTLFPRQSEDPFTHASKRMSVLCDFPPDARKMTTFHVSSSFSSSSSSQPIYFMKGALPVVLDHCTTISNAQGNIIDLTPQKQEMLLAAEKEMGENALRVVAVAYGTSPRSMNLVGLCGIMDPPRNGVLEAIREVQQTGVHVAMVTGDSRETAIAIARELSFFHRDSLALSSADLQRLSEEELASQIERVAVFYRMSPEDKMKIVKAYKNRGHIVAVTGDGVNDAPALKIADIGIAMGKGTDVCREAAEMILVDDNFATIVAAIEEGKSIYNNIKNFLRFQLTTSIATLSIIASSTLFGLPLPMNPIQILWINIIMDGPPAQSLGVEPLDKDAMKQPPRDTKQPVLSKPLLFSTLACALLMLFGTLGIYQSYLADPSYDIGEGDEEAAAQRTLKASTMAFNTFVFFQMFNAVNCRSDHKSAFQIKFMNNKFFLLAIGGSLLLQLAAIYVPILQMLFETTSLSLHELLQCLMVSSSVFGLDEARKYFLKAQQEGAVRFNV